jgi:type I restriction enzyme M protein
VITGELKAKVDRIWDAFWSGGIANPLEVMEQITYLLFIRRLDELQTTKENRANRLDTSIEDPIFPSGKDDHGRPFADLRWSRFKDRDPAEMFTIVGDHVFPFLREVGGEGSTYSHHMRDARFTIPTPALLDKVVGMLDELPMEGRDTKGDIYEYMLSKIATAGRNGQFRTPRHIIALMVAMTAPTPKDEICDPACGTAGFLIAAGDYVRRTHREVEIDREARDHFHNSMFHGFDFDSTMLRIGSMNCSCTGSKPRTSAIATHSLRARATRRASTPSSLPIHRSPEASTTRRQLRICYGSSRRRRRSSYFSPSSCGYCARAAALR